MSVYPKPAAHTPGEEDGRGLGRSDGTAFFRRQVQAIKAGVLIEDVANSYGEFRRSGSGRLVGKCVSPEHDERTGSLTIYPDTQRFKCFGCQAHGDVIDLVMLAERCELWVAMMIFNTRYGVELPQRPPSWFARQSRQQWVRDRIEAERIRHIRGLVFRLIWVPWLERLPQWCRENAARSAWDESEAIAKLLYAQRRRRDA